MKLVNDILNELGETFSAEELMKQLGGKKFIAMTGATNIAKTKDTLSMKLGTNPGKVTHVVFKLKNDLYNIDFLNIKGTKVKTIKKFDSIQASDIKDIFTDVTKLRLTL